MSDPKKWTQAEAIELCKKVEAICPAFGCRVALTGGLLYKDGPRKDCDILFYRIRQIAEINFTGLWPALEVIGLHLKSGFGWCYKGEYQGKSIDMFSPEEFWGAAYGEEDDRRDDQPKERDPLNASLAGSICGACECPFDARGGCGCNPPDA